MVDVDGVVGWLIEAVEYPHSAAALSRGGEDGESESLFVHYLRTAESKDEAAWFYLGNRRGIQTLIRPECIMEGAAMFRESRGIDNHQIIFAFR